MARKKKVLDPINCAVCGIEFTPADKRRRTCSRSCGGKLGNTKAAREKAKKTKMERYGDPNYNNREGMKRNLQEKYGEGITNPAQLPDVKAKIVKNYSERHGGMGMASKSVADKVLESVKEKHGIDDDTITNVGQIDAIKDKIRETHEERWGGIGFASEELFERSNKTFKEKYGEDVYGSKREEMRAEAFLEKYGVTSPYSLPSVRRKIKSTQERLYGGMGGRHKSIQEEYKENLSSLKEEYDPEVNIHEYAMKYNRSVGTIQAWLFELGLESKRPNKLNEEWAYYLDKELGVKFNYEGFIYGNMWRVDLYNEPLKLAIEINPTITHSSEPTVFHNRKVAVDYHKKRAELAAKSGWILLQIFDWDCKSDIIEQIKVARDINEDEVVDVIFSDSEIQLTSKLNHTFNFSYIENDEGLYVYIDKLIPKLSKTVIEKLKEHFNLSVFIITNQSSSSDYKIKEQFELIDTIKPESIYSNIDSSEVITIEEAYIEFNKLTEQKNYSKLSEFMNDKRFYRVYNAGSKIYKI